MNPVSAGFTATVHRCESCHGIECNDAGEVTDLRYDTLADTVRGLIAKLRRR
jgi:hypothetical protein